MKGMKTAAAGTQTTWNMTARTEALAEFGALKASEIRLAAGPADADAVTRLLVQRRIFAVGGPDGPLFPAFQFSDGEPRVIVAAVLDALGDHLRGWEILAWFTGSSGHLDGAPRRSPRRCTR